MVKMSPFAVTMLVMLLAAANADVSHLSGQNGYHYNNLGLTNGLKLHSPESDPAPTQYHATYQGGLPNSYVPPASGSPFGSVAPLPQNRAPTFPSQQLSVPIPTQRLSVPLQSPLFAGQKFGQQQYQAQFNFQQPKAYQAPITYQAPAAYQPQTYQTPAYQTPSYQNTQLRQPTFQAQGFAKNTFNNGFAQTAQTQKQVQSDQAQYQNNQEPIITKHFYVHTAPEDPEEDVGPRLVQIGRPHKNYKIIFINTPTYSTRQQIIPVLPQNEEKTVVYVLSKKPTFDQNIEIPEPPPTQPSKPDVFFIKYKTKQEAEQAQQQIQAAYDTANLSGNSDSIGQIVPQFDVRSSSESSSQSFGGQAVPQRNHQQDQNGGQYTSTTHTKRSVA